MSPVSLRALRPLALLLLALAGTFGLAACGGGMSQSDIEQKVDAASVGEENVADGASPSDLAKEQVKKDADARAAQAAVDRRQELAKIERDQKAEAEKVMNADTSASSATDLAEQKFRARLAGVCDGAQERISKLSAKAKRAQKAKDPQELLKVAQDYNDALNDFIAALKAVDAPPSEQALFTSWLGTIDDLASNIRLQLVSFADQSAYNRLEKKTESLTTRFITQTAQLGITCLSVT